MKKNNRCIDCQKLIYQGATRCRSCSKMGPLNNFYHKTHGPEAIIKMRKKRESIMGEKNPNFGKGLFGNDNPNWQNGISSTNYTVVFKKKLSPMVRLKMPRCQKCYKVSDLVVHHIDYNKINDCLNNLITLCRSCNAKVNFGKVFYSYLFKSKIEGGFIYYE